MRLSSLNVHVTSAKQRPIDSLRKMAHQAKDQTDGITCTTQKAKNITHSISCWLYVQYEQHISFLVFLRVLRPI